MSNKKEHQRVQRRKSHLKRDYRVDWLAWSFICEFYGGMCLRCKVIGDWLTLTPDHVKPKSKGGLDEPANYQPLCLKCNVLKGDDEHDFRWDKGKKMVKQLGKLRGNQEVQIPLAFMGKQEKPRRQGVLVTTQHSFILPEQVRRWLNGYAEFSTRLRGVEHQEFISKLNELSDFEEKLWELVSRPATSDIQEHLRRESDYWRFKYEIEVASNRLNEVTKRYCNELNANCVRLAARDLGEIVSTSLCPVELDKLRDDLGKIADLVRGYSELNPSP